jgi:glycosyltransferase involved in cell wall biosynthesis
MLTLVPGGMGGSETYVRALTRELPHYSDLDVTLLLPASAAGMTHGAREVVLPQLRGGGSTRARITTVVRAASPWFGGRSRLASADVVHYPLTVPVPMRRRTTPWVQTVHDVQHRDLPGLFSRQERGYRKVAYDRSARRADVVVTMSQFCKERLVARLGVEADRIRVAHLGVDADSFSPYDGPRRPFVLYPARGWPHKNHARLIEAVRLLRESLPDMRLVLTGGAAADLGPLPAWVEHRGLVSDADLRDLYRSASCLAFPSLYEGFGLPPLEAMASGCPVAAAATGSLPEVCGSAAVLFDPYDVSAIAAALSEAMASRERLVPLGLERARRFTWRACADVHADIYRELACG